MASVASGLVLASAEPALAHFSIVPGVVTDGETVELAVELMPVVTAPASVVAEGPGVSTISNEGAGRGPSDEWRWTVVVHVDAEPGPLPVNVVVRDAQGHTSRFRSTLTVVPPEGSGGAPGLATGVGAGLGVVIALAAVWLARRRA